MTNTCAKCAHWHEPEEWDVKQAGMGRCSRIKHESPLHVPLADVQRLASHLQFIKDKDYGDLLSAAQIAKAERVIRRLIKEHLNGKWDKTIGGFPAAHKMANVSSLRLTYPQ